MFNEDFIANPEGVLEEICNVTQLKLSDIARVVSVGEDMEVGHNFGGNRLRMSGTVRLHPEAERWKEKLSTKDRLLLSVVAGWLMRLYRYK